MVGFDAKNKNILDTQFICFICSLIIHTPIQCKKCKHRICQSCFEYYSEKQNTCPECLAETQTNPIIDEEFEKKMQSLSLECRFCNWVGALNDFQNHVDTKHPNPQCEYCDAFFQSVTQLNEHKVFECQKMTMDCLLKDFRCDEQIIRCDIRSHYSTEKHKNLLNNAIHQMKNMREPSDLSDDVSRSTTVGPCNVDTTLLQELYQICKILSNDGNILNNHEPNDLNNTLLQCQSKFPALNLELLRTKISIQEAANNSND